MTTLGTGVFLAGIHIYPLKSCRAIDLRESAVEPWGLAGDRRWLLVDEKDRFISQRQEPVLARVTVRFDPASGPGSIIVSAGTGGVLRVPAPVRAHTPGATADPAVSSRGNPEMLTVSVWRSTVLASAAGPEADAWFSDYLGRPVRLVYMDDPTRRGVDPEFGEDGDVVSFADGYPLLATSTGSLGQLGDWLEAAGHERVPMNRFRPSVVVSGAEPWAEDRWRRIRIGSVSFRVAKPCGRCAVTTTDQFTGQRGTQPLKMLGDRRRFGQAVVFGQNLIPGSRGIIRVGDPVEITERTDS